jgi:coenzyme F420-0:L-glutamate ligase/coenzyme F420-1:gamma-L-glutamate ligase
VSGQYSVHGIAGLPEITAGVDLARLLTARFDFRTHDVLVLAQKIVSKAEGRTVRLDTVVPSRAAQALALEAEKDPRVMQLLLEESREVMRVRPGVVIVEDRRGWVCANAGIDRSNIVQEAGSETVCLLPIDSDASARRFREGVRTVSGADIAVVIADSHGRAWREGTAGVAIGSAGLDAVSDRRGCPDRQGYALQHTLVGTADEVAAAASLLMGQGDESVPAVVLRGLRLEGPGQATDLQRPKERDLFR